MIEMKRTVRGILAILLAAMILTAGMASAASGEPSEETRIVQAGQTLTVTEDMSLARLTIEEGAQVVPAEGCSLVMVTQGSVVRPEAGSYSDVELILQPEDVTYGVFDETGNAEGYRYRFLFNTGGDNEIFISSALGGASVSEKGGYTVFDGNGAPITVDEDRMNVLAAVNDPVSVTLKNGSVWNVTADSYVASIDADDTSFVNGVINKIDSGYLVSAIAAQAAPSGEASA